MDLLKSVVRHGPRPSLLMAFLINSIDFCYVKPTLNVVNIHCFYPGWPENGIFYSILLNRTGTLSWRLEVAFDQVAV